MVLALHFACKSIFPSSIAQSPVARPNRSTYKPSKSIGDVLTRFATRLNIQNVRKRSANDNSLLAQIEMRPLLCAHQSKLGKLIYISKPQLSQLL